MTAKQSMVLAAAVAASLLLSGAAGGQGEDQEAKSPAFYEEAVDEAVERGLAYLASAQLDNGSFPSQFQGNTGITSLCIMAFLARGHTPGDRPYGETIDRGIDYVLDSRQDNGMLLGKWRMHGGMYSHSISTLLLSEVSGMVDPERQARIDEVLPRALEIILAAQRMEKSERFRGGWRYNPRSRDSDISCTGWPLMALRSARNGGAPVPKQAIDDALGFVMNCRRPNGGFAYQPGQGAGLARTGTALLCLELSGPEEHPAAPEAGDWILGHLQSNPRNSWFYYGLYYSAQGMYQLGGEHWERFGIHMYDTMLRLQREDGSWPPGSSHENRAGSCYTTAMTVLALGVPYAQLPIYQR